MEGGGDGLTLFIPKGDGVDGLLVLDDHVEPELVVHDGPQAHDAHMNIVRHVTNLAMLVPLRRLAKLVARQVGRLALTPYGQVQPFARRRCRQFTRSVGKVCRVLFVELQLLSHDQKAGGEVLDENVQAARLVAQKLSHPLDVVGAQGDFEVAQDLGRRGVAQRVAQLARRRFGRVGIQVGAQFGQVYLRRVLCTAGDVATR